MCIMHQSISYYVIIPRWTFRTLGHFWKSNMGGKKQTGNLAIYFRNSQKYSLAKWQRDQNKYHIYCNFADYILQSWFVFLWLFPKKSCSQTPAQLQNSSLTEMEAPFEPRKTHEKRHFFERFCTRFGRFSNWRASGRPNGSSIQSTRSNKTGYRNRDSFAKSLEAESIYPWKTLATITSWQVPFTVMQSAQTYQMEGIFQTWNFTPSRDKLLIMNTSCRIH